MMTVKENAAKTVAKCVETFSEMVARGAVGKSLVPWAYEVEEPKELLPKSTK